MRGSGGFIFYVIFFAVVFTIGVVFFIGNPNTVDEDRSQEVDTVAIYGALHSFIQAKYIDLDFITVVSLTDERWIAKEDNKVFILASQSKFFENPLLGYTSRYSTFTTSPVGHYSDSTLFNVELKELDMNGFSSVLSQSLPSIENMETDYVEALIINTIDSLVTSLPNLPAVTGSFQVAVVRKKCSYKIFPIDN